MKTVSFLLVAALCCGFDFFSSGPASKLDRYWDAIDNASTLEIDHQPWQQILDEYLVPDDSGVNLVDYEGVQEDGAELLVQYIASLAGVDPRRLNRDQKMSYWINLYNALTVQLVADNYPVDSIKDLGESLFGSGPWDDDVIMIAGRALSLNDIEHRILRPIFNDYRIHFAVNCASIGCPNLAESAFTADNLEQLLDQVTRGYLAHPRGIEFTGETLNLSSIFKWYQDDFGDSEQALLQTLGQYVDEDIRTRLQQFSGDAEYRYDWSLNDLG